MANQDRIEAFPLCWPSGVKRTANRLPATFSTRSEGRIQRLTVADARERVFREFEALKGCADLIISTNVELTLRGVPKSGQRNPEDPGACAYFNLNRKPHAMPCDKWLSVADNLAAIAKHVESIRGQARWGVADVDQIFTGFQALPDPSARWWLVLGVDENATIEQIQKARRAMAAYFHPDLPTGNVEKMAEINAAYDQALKGKLP